MDAGLMRARPVRKVSETVTRAVSGAWSVERDPVFKGVSEGAERELTLALPYQAPTVQRCSAVFTRRRRLKRITQ